MDRFVPTHPSLQMFDILTGVIQFDEKIGILERIHIDQPAALIDPT
jgi:hypothetical protein